ncbi:hypothetical protein Mtc_1197 [Methanocella conradii HZ254]|uniref:Uncharacterized protein n=1 Tax=Methanocella conradii (strain DSM 24694 / JCM 17849 / CGMCC 1.5162 / HZ254) TaxID=1041930 RepID=H8I8P6_METCZ|nr:hypothetical protein [Methanocella conradii]AFC99950.1 hypothetical protein Mtc_1197 [Methanocella conradii HZ254]
MGLTSKEWSVLLYFIEREGYAPVGSPQQKPFISYPAKIERDLGGDVSRGWAAKICEGFEKKGILGRIMVRPPRQSHTTAHYYLKRDLPAFRQVVRHVMACVRPADMHALFGYRYFSGMACESIIREALYEKGVEMRRTIRLPFWDTPDARLLFERYAKASGIEEDFDGYMSGLINKKDHECQEFDEISLRLPVFPDSMPKEEREKAFESLNKEELEKYPFIRFDSSGVKDHYQRYERQKLILPIMALIQVSPCAMAEFINGDWKPLDRTPRFDPEGTGTMEYLLFRLLFKALNDLAATRSIDGEGIARMAWLRKSNNVVSDDGGDALLTIVLNDGRRLYFDGGFDTDHDMGSRPEEDMDYWVRTWTGFDEDLCRGLLFKAEDVKDASALIRRLKDPCDRVASHIARKFSFEAQRIISYVDADGTPSPSLVRRLVDEINEVVMGECVYDEITFKDVALSASTLTLLRNKLSGGGATFEDYVLNHALLSDAFAGCLTHTII